MSDQERFGERLASRPAPVRRRASRHAQSGLPASLTSFVGRTREIADLAARLAETRLLTLTGIGGIGKSRLALEVARVGEDGMCVAVCLVELAAVSESGDVMRTIASALGVQENVGQPLLDGLVASLSHRETLLVLDNCEHVLETAAAVTLDLLRWCPALRVVATSRIPLDIPGEATWPVAPLAIPRLAGVPGRSKLARYAAVRLFIDRARVARPDFRLTDENASDVVQICVHLDGIPLAVELAAARISVLSPREIVQRLGNRFGLLAGGAQTMQPRHRTLRGVIDWSAELLDDREQILFRRLAVFAGGCTLQAAEVVCGGDGIAPDDVLDVLAQLVAKSLLLADHSRDETRFSMLETIREYAHERLRAVGEEPRLRQRHLDWVLAMAEQADVGLWTAEQRDWLARLDDELDNVRAALSWSAGPGDTERGLRIAGCLWRFWEQRGHLSEVRRWLSTLLSRSSLAPRPAHGLALVADAYFAHLMGDLATAHRRTEAALALVCAGGDRIAHVCALLSQGILVGARGDLAASQAICDDALALAREAGWEPGIRMALVDLGVVARFGGDHDRAAVLYEEALGMSKAAGDSYTQGFCFTYLAHLALSRGDPDVAVRRYQEALLLWRDLRDVQNVAMTVEGLAWAVGAQGRHEHAARLLGAADALRALVGAAILPHWHPEHERARADAQVGLGEQAFAFAWAHGRAMTLEQAVTFGLAWHLNDERQADDMRPTRAGHACPPLTQRETEVARLVARGLTDRQVAQELILQESTVGNHLQRIYTRLGLNGRVQLAAWLAEHDREGEAPAQVRQQPV